MEYCSVCETLLYPVDSPTCEFVAWGGLVLARLIAILATLVGSVSLLVSEGFLDGYSSLLLRSHSIRSKLSPKLFELGAVSLQIEGVINDEQVLLVVCSGLECPVEGASEKECIINNHELVVHMVLLRVIGTHRDSSIGQILTIVSSIGHTLVIRDDTHLATLLVNVLDGIGEHIIRQVKHADRQLSLSHLDVALQLVDIVAVREKEGVNVARLRSVEVFLNLGDVLAQVCQDSFVSITAHLIACNLKKLINGALNRVSVVATWHLGNSAAQRGKHVLISSHVITVSELLNDLVV